MRIAYCDLEQAESRVVGAICLRLFGDSTYLDACSSGDLHTSVCALCWTDLPWPAGFNLAAIMRGQRFDDELLSAAKGVAGASAYRSMSYRDLAKRLGHGCLTADHEVLTPTGWQPITAKPPIIMQGDGTFQRVSHWIDQPYEGKMIEWQGQSLSAKMTANHRVYYSIDAKSGIQVRSADTVPASASILLSSPTYRGGRLAVPDARLLAAYHCDGWWNGYSSVSFHFHKQRKKDRIKLLATAQGIAWREAGNKLYLHWRPSCTEPHWSMLFWDAESLNAYTDELAHWDGHIGKTSISLHSAKRDWLELWQTFNRLLGCGGNIQKPKTSGFGTTMYCLQVNNRSKATRRSFTVDTASYETCQVYCPTVPCSSFYIRRHGKISLTGNSNYRGQPPTMAQHSHVDVHIIRAFQRRYFGAFSAIPRWHDWVEEQIQLHRQLTTMLGRRIYVLKDPTAASTLREMIAYEPQSVGTGDYMNAGIQLLDAANLPLELLKQVHDAVAFEYDYRDEDWLIPTVRSILSWTFPLQPHPERFAALQQKRRLTAQETLDLQRLEALAAAPRPFSIPVEAQVGWNLGKYDERKNPNGLRAWAPGDPRRRAASLPMSNGERLMALLPQARA